MRVFYVSIIQTEEKSQWKATDRKRERIPSLILKVIKRKRDTKKKKKILSGVEIMIIKSATALIFNAEYFETSS